MSSPHRLVRALLCETVDRPPLWIMRQAGRYLPEYRAVRKKAGDFLTLCKTPELACEVTLQPLKRFPLDAAILFSDILLVPEAMGMEVQFLEEEGPRFSQPLRSEKDIMKLKTLNPKSDLAFSFETIRLVTQALNQKIPVIGFAGSPWTLAAYMLEGGSSAQFTEIRRMMYQSPSLLHQLLTQLTEAVSAYLGAQIEAGVEVVMLFDTWGNLLSPIAFQRFSLHYMDAIAKTLQSKFVNKKVPIIFFTRNSSAYLSLFSKSACNALGLDWTVDLKEARKILGSQFALQGNLDPALLYAAPDTIRQAVKQLLSLPELNRGFVFNLGHGIAKDTLPEQVSVLIEALHTTSITA